MVAITTIDRRNSSEILKLHSRRVENEFLVIRSKSRVDPTILLFLCSAKIIELDKIRVGAVSYLNTKPYIWGLQHSRIMDQIDLLIDYPSRIAAGLIKGDLDVGLVPVAVIPDLQSYTFVGDYGIACDGEVASVALFSEVPLGEIKTILLDYQSRTSVALLKILLKKHWKIEPDLIDVKEEFQDRIQGDTAGLVIGDRALEIRSKYPYVYDLGLAWKQMTGLPFVFAAWVSVKPLDAAFVKEFSEACALGVGHLVALGRGSHLASYNLQEYYTKNIHFYIDDAKKIGMRKFWGFLSEFQ